MTRGARPIDPEVRVVNGPGVPGIELDGAHVACPVGRNRQHEGPEDVGAVSPQRVRLRHLDDDVRSAELPSRAPFGQRRQVGGISFDGALRRPVANRPDLRVGQHTRTDELTRLAARLPRRHHTARRDVDDLRRALPHVEVRGEGERSDFAGAMTGRAVLENDRRDVARKGDLALCRARRYDQQHACNQSFSHRSPMLAYGCRACTANTAASSRSRRRHWPDRRTSYPSPPAIFIVAFVIRLLHSGKFGGRPSFRS